MFISKRFTKKALLMFKYKYFKNNNIFGQNTKLKKPSRLDMLIILLFSNYYNFFYNFNQTYFNFILFKQIIKKTLNRKIFDREIINKKKIILEILFEKKKILVTNKLKKKIPFNKNFKNKNFFLKNLLKQKNKKIKVNKKLKLKKLKLKKLINKVFNVVFIKNKLKNKLKIFALTRNIKKYDLILKLLLTSLYSFKEDFEELKDINNLKFLYNYDSFGNCKDNSLPNLYNIFYKNKKNFLFFKKYYFKKKYFFKFFFSKNIDNILFTRLHSKSWLIVNNSISTPYIWFCSLKNTSHWIKFIKRLNFRLNHYKFNLNNFNLPITLNSNILSTYLMEKINKDYDYKFKFDLLKNKRYDKKTGFIKYYKINTKINKKHYNTIYTSFFFINYINCDDFILEEQENLKKINAISQIKNFYKFHSLLKYIHLKLNKYWIIKNTKQLNKIYIKNKYYKKKLKLLNKSLILFTDMKLDNNKISNEYKYRYKILDNIDLNSYMKLKYLLLTEIKEKFFNITKQLNLSKSYFKDHNIFNYMYINKNTILHHFIKFFNYTKFLNKDVNDVKIIDEDYKAKTYFFNCWQGLLTGWKNARQFHWDLYNKAKTLKKRRYKNFLPPFLKKNKIVKDIIINHFTFKFNFSNIFWNIFTKLYLYFFNKTLIIKEIFQIPINYLFWIFLQKLKKDKLKIKKKIVLWLEKNVKIRKTFWMLVKKKIPKFFSKQIYKIENFKNIIQYDYITNYFCILKEKKTYTNINDYIFSNKLLKLHNFRYKA